MSSSLRLVSVSLAALGIAAAAAAAEPEVRYLAEFTDGARLEGKTIHGWHTHQGMPRLDSTNLADANRPLRRLRDLGMPDRRPEDDAAPRVELVGGDRLPGRVVGFEQESFTAAACHPAHLLVEPAVSVSLPGTEPLEHVRVLPDRVRRVVLGGSGRRQLRPGTLFYRDGRRVSYRSLRWGPGWVTLLAKDGIRRVALAETAEIHLPPRDPWEAYYRELAAVSPDGSSRLVTLETPAALIATDSVARFRASAPPGADSDPGRWHHMVQPAWSLDPLWVPFKDIRTRLYFSVDEVPLSRVRPAGSVQRSLLAVGAHWQADRNVQGGPLESGGRRHGWGFGVHATCELWFDLPGCVRGFHGRVGLDRIAGSGGCARALVYVNRPAGNPIYRTGHLIGSQQVVDMGTVSLSGPAGGQRSLVLVADSAHTDHPPDADPLDIGDMVDWLEPVLLLDRGRLDAEVQKVIAHGLGAPHGWTVGVEGGGPVRLESIWYDGEDERPCYVQSPVTEKRALTFSTQCRISAADNWLLMRIRQLAEGSAADAIECRVDGRRIAWIDVPRRGPAAGYWVPLPPRDERPARIEVIYTPGDERKRIQWQALRLARRPAGVRWAILVPAAVRSLGSATFKPQPDGSLLVEGTPAANDVYTIIAPVDLPRITALRLEALPDASLPGGGPGRADDGNFALSRFSVAVAPQKPQPLQGRYVRIELPKPPLCLAEVQVIGSGKNLAPAGKASQSSTAYDAPAARAIDNNTNGDFFNGKSVSHTSEDGENSSLPAWWEVDLGGVRQIDGIAVWNRTGGFGERLSNFRFSVLDAQRKTVWEQVVAGPPDPCLELDNLPCREIPLKSAAADHHQEDRSAQQAVKGPSPTEDGWSIAPQTAQRHVAVFTAEEPFDARQSLLVVKLKHLSSRPKHTLGRFRLAVTGDQPPDAPQDDGVNVPVAAVPQ